MYPTSSLGSLIAAIILLGVGFMLGYFAKKNHIHAQIDEKLNEVKDAVKGERLDLQTKVKSAIEDIKKVVK